MRTLILAYGPTAATEQAVRRARRLGPGDVAVVPATELGVPRGLPGRTTVAGSLGTRGLVEILTSVNVPENEPVLLVHDDVLLTPAAAAAMAAAWDRAGGVVVPYTNDRGTDHFAGPLPPASAAGRLLDERARIPGRSDIGLVRPSCLLGTVAALAAFIDRHVVDPRVMVRDLDGVVTAAGIAAHDGTCGDRLLPAGTLPDGRPLLVASMIVRDEETTLPECLASLDGLVDRIEIVDTGSTDSTIAVARSLGAHVTEIPWPDDFGAARTAALDRCRDAHYALVVDADERITCEDPALVRGFLATYRHEYEGFRLQVMNVGDDPRHATRNRSVRILTTEESAYDGRIHEQPVRRGRMIGGSDLDLLEIVHVGYTTPMWTAKSKSDRNLSLARTQYEEGADPRTAYEYLRTLLGVNPADPELPGVAEAALAGADSLDPATRAVLFSLAGRVRLASGDPEAARSLARRGLDLVPDDAACAELFLHAAEALDEPAEIVDLFAWRIGQRSASSLFADDDAEVRFASGVAGALARLGRREEAYALAADVLEANPALFGHWRDLVGALRPLSADIVSLLAPLAALDPTAGAAEALAEVLRPAETARLCLALAGRSPDPGTVAVGLLAAVVAGDEATGIELAAGAGALDPGTAAHIRERAADRSLPRLAAALATATTPATETPAPGLTTAG